METIPTYAVIPSCGRSELARCLDSLSGQVEGVVAVVNNGYFGEDLTGVYTVPDQGHDRNISRWWNLGMRFVAGLADSQKWNVIVLNDDVIMGSGSVGILVNRMRETSASLAFPGPGPEQLLRGFDGPRITGWCFSLPGEDRMDIDESFVWWCGDNDIDMWSRMYGRGSLSVPGINVQHTAPNAYMNDAPSLGLQAGRDVETFRAKWLRNPY